MDAFTRLWQSTTNFHQRFDRFPPVTQEAWRVFDEECAEFFISIEDSEPPENQLAEAADVIVTIQGVLMSKGFTLEQINAALDAVAAKNDAKTYQTHYRHPVTGKVTRKGK